MWLLTLHFVHFHFWSYRCWGHPYTLPRGRARPLSMSIVPHSWLPGRKSPPQGCCPGGSRWRCSCVLRTWRHCRRNPLRECFLDISVSRFGSSSSPWMEPPWICVISTAEHLSDWAFKPVYIQKHLCVQKHSMVWQSVLTTRPLVDHR